MAIDGELTRPLYVAPLPDPLTFGQCTAALAEAYSLIESANFDRAQVREIEGQDLESLRLKDH